jgi:flagellin
MSSILTNVGAMAALQSLNATNKSLQTTQNRISSGLRIESAKDNSSSWAIATTMRSDISAFKAIGDNLNMSQSTVSVARSASEAIAGLLDEIKAKVTLAGSNSVDKAKIQDDLAKFFSQIQTTVDAAQFNGVNYIDGSQTGTIDLLASLNRDSAGVVTTGTIGVDAVDLNTTTGGGLAALAAIDVSATGFDVDTALATVETAIGTVTDAAAAFGAVENRLSIQSDFVAALTDALTTGVGSMVDANMEEESARLSALQVQQQLGIQALSIANSAPQNVLALFR